MGLDQVEYFLLKPNGSDTNDKTQKCPKAATIRNKTCGRNPMLIICLFSFLLIYLKIARIDRPAPMISLNLDSTIRNTNATLTPAVPEGHLVWSPQCKIKRLDPFAPDVMKLYHQKKPLSCATKDPLTTVQWNAEQTKYYLTVNEAVRRTNGTSTVDHCTFREITRKSENYISTSTVVKFSSNIELSDDAEFVYVECFQSDQSLIYQDVHFVVQRKSAVVKRLQGLKKENMGQIGTSKSIAPYNPHHQRIPSVLMIGIDSMSRLNLLRTMPNTAQHLHDNDWFEMKGYNKMGDNTYPNLMAILTGFNETWAHTVCKPKKKHGLENCPFVWKKFAAAGFVTGFAEDEPGMDTFNYLKRGFRVSPTDFYGRAGMIAADKLPKVMSSDLAICLGYRSAADYVYKYGLDIAETYRKEGTFGLYWVNSFSHNDLSTPSSMDDRIKFYLEDLEQRGILNDSIVVFFSDHGLRFGPIRRLDTGWMEERLPFLFFWLPPWFREMYPEIVQSLRLNRNRLTNPYDLHVTLKHILRLSGRASDEDLGSKDVAMGCENCQSIFREVPWNRSCREIEISTHWCTCDPYMPISKDTKLVKGAAKFLVGKINGFIKGMLNGTTNSCSELRLHSIYSAYKSDKNNIRIQFKTRPGGGEFESTISYVKNQFRVSGKVSRLNSYAGHSDCISNESVQMYCECL